MPLSSRVLASLAAASLPILCSSCFTIALWSAWDDEADEPDGDAATYTDEDDTECTWDSVGLRLLLTPVAIGLDLLSCPVQVAMCGDGKE